MISLRLSRPADLARVLDIWRLAVDATHHFLTPQDRHAIETEVAAAFPQLQLILAVDTNDTPLGFMLLGDAHLEALFIDPAHHGCGIGKILVRAALEHHPGVTVDVNEQNTAALAFYERQGFERTGRSATDDQGRPYPLLHLRHRASGPASAR